MMSRHTHPNPIMCSYSQQQEQQQHQQQQQQQQQQYNSHLKRGESIRAIPDPVPTAVSVMYNKKYQQVLLDLVLYVISMMIFIYYIPSLGMLSLGLGSGLGSLSLLLLVVALGIAIPLALSSYWKKIIISRQYVPRSQWNFSNMRNSIMSMFCQYHQQKQSTNMKKHNYIASKASSYNRIILAYNMSCLCCMLQLQYTHAHPNLSLIPISMSSSFVTTTTSSTKSAIRKNMFFPSLQPLQVPATNTQLSLSSSPSSPSPSSSSPSRRSSLSTILENYQQINTSNNPKYNDEQRTLLQNLVQLRLDIIQDNTNANTNNNDDENENDTMNQQKIRLLKMLQLLESYQQQQQQQKDPSATSSSTLSKNDLEVQLEASRIIDNVMRHCTKEAFQLFYYQRKSNNGGFSKSTAATIWQKIQFGLDIIDLQLSGNIMDYNDHNDHDLDHDTSSSSLSLLKRKKILLPPYDTIPQSVCLQALKALNVLLMKKQKQRQQRGSSFGISGRHPQIQQTNAAFRILQRLCTGVGIRSSTTNTNTAINDEGILSSSSTARATAASPGKVLINLDERDFNMVLNGYVNTKQMNEAHRVIALQVRTPHAPPISPITYSILIKGYGNLRDLHNVELCMKQCWDHGVKPDIIMYNSLIDAYVNCNEIGLAYEIFEFLMKGGGTSNSSRSNDRQEKRRYYGSKEQPYLLYDGSQDNHTYENEDDSDSVSSTKVPLPNTRTYNTMLKGFVKNENMKEAMKLSNLMKENGLWDDITTNTLVGVAVATNEFNVAESILLNYTSTDWANDNDERSFKNSKNTRTKGSMKPKRNKRSRYHPNVEAYTELLNGYAKAGQLNKALNVLKTMRQRGVNPNEYTYTCIIGALAKAQKTEQAMKLMKFMEASDGIRPSVVTYNAFLTGMLEKYIIITGNEKKGADKQVIDYEEQDFNFNSRVDEAMKIFRSMIQKSNVNPNVITTTTMVEALGRCKPSRVNEAKALILGLDKSSFISKTDRRVCTALMRAYANTNDLEGIEQTFHTIRYPDTISFNAMIEGYCRCGKVKKALVAMADNNDQYRDEQQYIRPDVATYTILLSSVLKIGTSSASSRAMLLYNEMKRVWEIMPDRALVDVILTAMVSGGNSLGINDEDIRFTTTVLNDAKNLDWKRGEYRKRQMAVKGIFMGRLSEAWKEDEQGYGMNNSRSKVRSSSPKMKNKKEAIDPLFQKKNWNQIDSGFKLWGGGGVGNSGGEETGSSANSPTSKSKNNDGVDEFLESKNWNDIDSSFRIL